MTAILSPCDTAYLTERAMPSDQAERLGYRTVARAEDLPQPAELLRHPDPTKAGWFGKLPRFSGPALMIPVRAASGDQIAWQAIPATPRLRPSKNGKPAEPAKKEWPSGTRLTIHVPLGVRDILGNPTAPLGMAESHLKADVVTLAGQATIGFCGVDGWKVNDGTRSVVVPELEAIPLANRVVFLFNDSDLHQGNESVAGAYGRQCDYIRGRGGIPLDASPPPAADGSKQGPDDFIANGGTVAELVTLAITRLADSRKPAAPTLFDGGHGCTACTEKDEDLAAIRGERDELRERLDIYRLGNWSQGQALVVDEINTRVQRFRRRDGWNRIPLDYATIGKAVGVSKGVVGEVVRRIAVAKGAPLTIDKEPILDRYTGEDTGRSRVFGDIRPGNRFDDPRFYATLVRPGASDAGEGGTGGAREGAGRPKKGCSKHPAAQLVRTTRREWSCQDCGDVVDRCIIGRSRLVDPPEQEARIHMITGSAEEPAAAEPIQWNATRLPEPVVAAPPPPEYVSLSPRTVRVQFRRFRPDQRSPYSYDYGLGVEATEPNLSRLWRGTTQSLLAPLRALPGGFQALAADVDGRGRQRMSQKRSLKAALSVAGPPFLLTFEAYTHVRAECGDSDMDTWRWLAQQAKCGSRPLFVTVEVDDGSSHTIALAPAGWSAASLLGYTNGQGEVLGKATL